MVLQRKREPLRNAAAAIRQEQRPKEPQGQEIVQRCRAFDDTGHCRFGNNCRYHHILNGKKPVNDQGKKDEKRVPGKGGKGPARGKCHICGQFGHFRRECPKGRANVQSLEGEDDAATLLLGSVEGTIQTFDLRRKVFGDDFDPQIDGNGTESADTLAFTSGDPSVPIVLDSGATEHASPDTDYVNGTERQSAKTLVSYGGATHVSLKKGDLKRDTQVGELLLRDVSHHDLGKFTLVSVAKLAEEGMETTFKKNSAQVVRSSDGALVATASLRNNLYFVDVKDSLFNQLTSGIGTTLEGWHARFAHIGHAQIERLAREKIVDGMVVHSVRSRVWKQNSQKGL
jgi:hypothetical protein